MNEINVDNNHISASIADFLSLANRAYSTLTRQLEAVINEISMTQVLRLRTNPWHAQVHEGKYLPPTKVTYSHIGFHKDQASYCHMKVHTYI